MERQSLEFVHLHNHSEYSMLDGVCRVPDMIQWAVENSAPAVALTDHGNMFGAWEFYTTAQKAGVNPIVGCEVYVAPGDRKSREKGQGKPYHLTLLAENAAGYRNLLKLVSLGYIEGFYNKPRIDMEILREYREGVIVLTGCIRGQVPQLLCSGKREEGIQCFKTLIDIMGTRNLYVEIQNHYIDKELKAYPMMVNLAKEFDIPIVGTNDCHYLRKSDHRIHDVLLCIQTKTTVNDPNRIRFDNHYYFKSVSEMRETLKKYPPEAISNTYEIAKRCSNFKLDYGNLVMPKYEVPDGQTNDSYLKDLCYQGLREKFRDEIPSTVQEQLDYELDIIRKTGYAGYFLIVWDYVNYANRQGYPLSARGSAASSLALYALGVNTFNPMDYDCMFERFLNTERVSPPDIDIDFADRSRDHVIEYLVNKYGQESVGKVATFSTLGPKAAITDVGRALEIPLKNVRKLTRLIPGMSKVTLEDILALIPEFRELAQLPENTELIDISKAVVGMKRHVSCHASAVVVSSGPLTDYVPLFTDKHGQVATQFEGKTVEDVGIVKFDSLGLRSLTKTDDCIQMVKENRGKDIKLTEIPFDDKKTYSLVSKGLIAGLFQLETSPGMYRVVTQLKPENFADFTAIPAIYRPGPLESGTTRQFIARKNGLQKVEYIHPSLKNALKNTYGLCVYQEQVMQIAQDMAGFTLGEADVLRNAMGKRNEGLLKAQRQKFITGAAENSISKAEAEKVFDILEPFGGYAFNKSHTVAYSIVTYRMAYLKTHYPHEFIAAIMTGEADDISKIICYREESKRLADFLNVQINLLPPDVNKSSKFFTVDGDNIYFGLIAVKHVGDRAIDAILEAREQGGPFTSLQDFCIRVNTRVVNKRTIESLILCGAFDSLEGHRAPLIANLQTIMKGAKIAKAERERGQLSLFKDAAMIYTINPAHMAIPEYEPFTRFQMEKQLLGFYVSGHPVQEYMDIIENYTTANTQTLDANPDVSEISIIGMITRVKKLLTRKGDTMALLALEDSEGMVKAAVLPEIYKKVGGLVEGQIVWINGELKNNPHTKNRNNHARSSMEKYLIHANEIIDVVDVPDLLTSTAEVTIPESDLKNYNKFQAFKEIALANRGDLHLILRLMSPRFGEVIVHCGANYKLVNKDSVFKQVESLFGQNCIKRSNRT